jgi:hypothetical protein
MGRQAMVGPPKMGLFNVKSFYIDMGCNDGFCSL